MDSKLTIAVIGGDGRQTELASLFAANGHTVRAWHTTGEPEGAQVFSTAEQALEGAEVTALPLPLCAAHGVVNGAGDTRIEEIFALIPSGTLAVAGRVPPEAYIQARNRNVELWDYAAREDFMILNAMATAEGALERAMALSRRTIHGTRCLVVGRGRIGRILARYLRELGAKVTVTARSSSDLTWLTAEGFDCIQTSRLGEVIPECRIIFNTVPTSVVTREHIAASPHDAVFIDLASAPGGIDMSAARELGRTAEWALSLPGRAAPASAAGYIRDCVYNIIDERMGRDG